MAPLKKLLLIDIRDAAPDIVATWIGSRMRRMMARYMMALARFSSGRILLHLIAMLGDRCTRFHAAGIIRELSWIAAPLALPTCSPIIASTDTKVSATPSSNRFARTLVV